MRIAIVGSGVSGLAAAWLLRGAHDVHVLEAEGRVGGHANTVDVQVGGTSVAVDTGFIVHNRVTYPRFCRLLGRLGVATDPSDMSFGVRCERTGIEWSSHGLGGLLARPGNALRPVLWRMVRDVLRFNREARGLLASGADPKMALADYLCGAGYSREFTELYVVPMGAAIWSADPDDFLRFPAARFVRFFHHHGLLSTRGRIPWRVVRGGSRRYVDALRAELPRPVETGTPVRAVERGADGPVVVTADGARRRFDRVVLAVHSDQALALLAQPTADERRILSAVRYQGNEALLHTDASVLPRSPRARASWNYRIPRERRSRVLVSYDMGRLQDLDVPVGLFVSLNAGGAVDPAQVLGRWEYAHPVFDAAAIAAQARHAAIDGSGGVHYAGAWWFHGFHEDGVRSAERVSLALGGDDLGRGAP